MFWVLGLRVNGFEASHDIGLILCGVGGWMLSVRCLGVWVFGCLGVWVFGCLGDCVFG